jgi:hypothetical protein
MSSTVADVNIHEQLADWNRSHPDGTEVTYLSEDGDVRTKTRGNALALNGRIMVHLLGVQGAVPVYAVKPCYCRWVKLNRRGRVNHWVYGVWSDRTAMDRDIQSQIDRDPKIVSHEVSNLKPMDA